MAKGKLQELRDAVLGNQRRGREVEVNPDGQVVIDSESSAKTDPPEQDSVSPKPPKMSPITWAA